MISAYGSPTPTAAIGTNGSSRTNTCGVGMPSRREVSL
jgi:hypothetical protein